MDGIVIVQNKVVAIAAGNIPLHETIDDQRTLGPAYALIRFPNSLPAPIWLEIANRLP